MRFSAKNTSKIIEINNKRSTVRSSITVPNNFPMGRRSVLFNTPHLATSPARGINKLTKYPVINAQNMWEVRLFCSASASINNFHRHALIQYPQTEITIDKLIQRKEAPPRASIRLSNLISLYKNQKIQMANARERTTCTSCLVLN